MFVFEYGSGGSTIFFSNYVNKLISIEHDINWYKLVSDVLSTEKISNCDYILIEPTKCTTKKATSYNYRSYSSILIRYKGFNFKNYVKSIEKYPNGSFDLVFIDGRARASCVYHAISKIRLGGYLVLDNSNRPHYSAALLLLKNYKRLDFFGIGPYLSYPWQTSIWKIDS